MQGGAPGGAAIKIEPLQAFRKSVVSPGKP